MNLWSVVISVFVLNVPFGYWRANTRKFSLQWFMAVHIPVPIVIAFRIFAGVGWHLITFPILMGAFFFGHVLGGKLHSRFVKKKIPVSSCLVWDLVDITNTFRSKDDKGDKEGLD